MKTITRCYKCDRKCKSGAPECPGCGSRAFWQDGRLGKPPGFDWLWTAPLTSSPDAVAPRRGAA